MGYVYYAYDRQCAAAAASMPASIVSRQRANVAEHGLYSLVRHCQLLGTNACSILAISLTSGADVPGSGQRWLPRQPTRCRCVIACTIFLCGERRIAVRFGVDDLEVHVVEASRSVDNICCSKRSSPAILKTQSFQASVSRAEQMD